MIFTTDRVQFKDGKFIVFEFYNSSKETGSFNFVKDKMLYLKDISNFDICYAISYDNNKFTVITYDNVKETKRFKNMTYADYQMWFLKINRSSGHSKALGSAKSGIGDEYVQNILNELNNEYKFDFKNDDNGLELTMDVLSGEITTGFDFDLFETESRSIIEFLKRENEYITNLSAHPSRYLWNKQKFTSLWEAKKRVNGELFLVNYSNESSSKDNYISIIKVIDYSEKDEKIIFDIGYSIDGYKDLIKWLTLLKNDSKAAANYLEIKPKQVRDYAWWKDVYGDFVNNKKRIGEKYV